MKTFEELYDMYTRGDDNIALELFSGIDFNELYKECDKHLAKYYEFKCWLEYAEDYYNITVAEDAAFLKEDNDMKKYVVYYAPEEDWIVAETFATEEEAIAYCDEVERIYPCYYEEED